MAPRRVPLDATLVAASADTRRGGVVARALDRLAAGFFPPGQPLTPVAPPETEARRWDFPFAWNTRGVRREGNETEELSFQQLRQLADSCELIRLAIETRKAQVSACEWEIQAKDVDPTAGTKAERPPGADEVTERLERPDGQRRWKRWIKMAVEDLLVLDGVAIYRRPTRKGGVYALELLDAATIKPLLDERGNEPIEGPAYQQFVKGLPAVEFTRDELLYEMLCERTNRIYGNSPVQQINLIANLAIRRSLWQIQTYTDGTIPEAIYQTPSNWSIQTVREFQAYWDSLFEGDQAQKRRMRAIPGGEGASITWAKSDLLKDEIEEWLARVVCYAFSLPPTWAVKVMNRATAETAEAAALAEGREPLKAELADIMTEAIARFYGYDDLVFAWREATQTDPLKQAQVHDLYVRGGILSVDEVREDLGRAPIGVGPAVYTAAGPVFWDDVKAGALLPPEPGALPDPNDPNAQLALPAPGEPDAPDAPPPADEADDEAEADDQEDDRDARKLAKRGRLTVRQLSKRQARLRAGRVRNDAYMRGVVRVLAGEILTAFGATIDAVAAQVPGLAQATRTPALRKEAVEDAVARLLREIDLANLQVTEESFDAAFRRVGAHGVEQALAGLRVAVPTLEAFAMPNEPVVDYARARAAELVGKRVLPSGEIIDSPNPEYAITEGTRTLLRGTLTTALEQGWSREELRTVLTDSYAFSERRAMTIARTELSRALVNANVEAWKASGVVKAKQWILGSLHDDDDECLLGETPVRVGTVLKTFERVYSGPLVELHLSNGHQLTGTPNHPVLTNAGWKPLGALHEGDHLATDDILHRVAAVAHDFEDVEARFEDVVRAFGNGSATLPASPGHFHGDGAGSEVYVIRAHGTLRGPLARMGDEGEQALLGGRPDEPARLAGEGGALRPSLPDGGVLAGEDGGAGGLCVAAEALAAGGDVPLGGSAPPATNSGIGGPGTGLALVGGGASGGEALRVGQVAEDVAGRAEAPTDRLPGYPGPSGDLVRRQLLVEVQASQDIQGDARPALRWERVVGVRLYQAIAVPVFNAATLHGVYLACGVIVSNCDGNAADGVIGIDEEFSSGTTLPPAHPRCICDVLPILSEDGRDG